MLEISSSSEIKLSGTDIYFDSKAVAVPLSFVSSANIDTSFPEAKRL